MKYNIVLNAYGCKKYYFQFFRYPGTDCTNSKWPDMHGHYREPKYSQTKHHWWWKANHIFHNIDVLKQFTGHVVFLEEDHYVAPDFMLLLDMMKYHQDNKHKNVRILKFVMRLLTLMVRGFLFHGSSVD